MAGFLPPAERHSSALLGIYAGLSLILLVTGERIPAASLRGFGAWLFAPLDRVVLSTDRMAAAWRENQRLHQRIAELELENTRLKSFGFENQTLRRELGLPSWQGQPVQAVEILSLSGEPMPVAATVSAGRRQGADVGDIVVTEDGLLGRIAEAYGSFSRVTLITDPAAAVACEVESTGVLGVLRTEHGPTPRIVLTGVPLSDTIRVGQRILTSGLSRRFLRGIPVGTVTRVGHDQSGLVQQVEVRPAARFSRLRHGFVLDGPREQRQGTP